MVSSTSAGLVGVTLNVRAPWSLGCFAARATERRSERRSILRDEKTKMNTGMRSSMGKLAMEGKVSPPPQKRFGDLLAARLLCPSA